MKKHTNTVFSLIFAICIFFTLSSISEAQNTHEFKFRYINVENGLSCNNVRALMQDKYGYIWIGTDKGLNRYDGHSITFPRGQKSDISIQSLCESGDTVWIGSSNGLLCYSHHTDSITPVTAKTNGGTRINSIVTGICSAKDGSLWVSTMYQGVFHLKKDGHLRQYLLPEKGMDVANILITQKGEIWAISNWCKHNLAKYNAASDQFESIRTSSDATCQGIELRGITFAQTHDGTYWIGTWENGLIRLDHNTMKASLAAESTNETLRHIHSITEIDKTHLYISSDEGLSIYNTLTGSIEHHKDDELTSASLSDKFVYPILKDKEGGIWVGTFYGGLNYAHPETANFKNYFRSTYHNSVNGNIVNNFREDSNGNIWIASDDGGLSMLNTKTNFFQSYDTRQGGQTRNVHGLFIDGSNLFIGTYTGGIDVLNIQTGTEKHIPAFWNKDGKSLGTSSYAILKDRKGRIWVGTFSDILLFDESTGMFHTAKETKTMIIDIDEDRKGNIWFVTDGKGIYRFDGKSKWTQYTSFANGENNNDTPLTNSLFEDVNGNIWLGTSNGLFRYDAKSDTFKSTKLRNRNPEVMGLTGKNDRLWLTTSYGLMLYSIKENKVLRIYTSGDGLDNINFLQNSLYMSGEGKIYIGTSHGYSVFSPNDMQNNVVKPNIAFTGIELFNKPVMVGSSFLSDNINEVDKIEFAHNENSLKISFSAMSYLIPENNMYQFYLEGYENEWNAPTHEHSVTYTNLEPGTYVLHVRAANNDGVWTDDDTTLAITITPPFYWNTPVRCIYFLILVGIIYAIIRYFLKKKEMKYVAEIEEINTQKEAEVHEARIKFMTISDTDNEFLKRLEDIIEKNFSNPDISVDFLASEMNVSRSGLFAKVKSLADVTPNEMIQIIRLKHAARLLESKQYRINEICYMVGFNSPSYFTKCFSKHFGVKPAEYATSK